MNQVRQWLQQKQALPELVQRLARSHGLSPRQAYRYVEQAQSAAAPLPVPEIKDVFTVKLPRRLIDQVRRRARKRGWAISDWVAQALEHGLQSDQPYG